MKKIIAYGAGEFGKQLSGFLNYKGYDGLYCFADRDATKIGKLNGYSVKSPDECVSMDFPFVILIRDNDLRTSVEASLREKGCDVYRDITAWVLDSGMSATEWHRDYVSYVHINDMLDYYKKAEGESCMNIFWNGDSPFFSMFSKLDLTDTVELACGHGRHVTKYIKDVNNLTLVDVLDENINFCKERFELYKNIRYYHNNGRDLREIPNESCSCVFSYDAMVHFEMMDVWSYLKEIHRILKKEEWI